MKKRIEVVGDNGLIITAPGGKLKDQYLWFGNKDGRHVGTLRHKAKLKKVRRWINEILDE